MTNSIMNRARTSLQMRGLDACDEPVLDVGCGIGRMARPLAGYLDDHGSYDGFDINAQGIARCEPRCRDLPNFRLQLADVYNAVDHPAGSAPASEYRFPCDDAGFDLVMATSVFTHLMTGDALHSLDEVARVLAPGGRLLARPGRSALAFEPLDGRSAVVERREPATSYQDIVVAHG